MPSMSPVEADFRQPPSAQRPMLRWWWPGGAVEAEALCAQLRGFADAGWGGVEIQPCRVGLPHGLTPAQSAAVHEVFTPPWFETVATVMAEAARLGLLVDVTFGSAWPFGGGEAITPELATSELTLAWTTVRGPQHWHGVPRQPERPLRSATWLARQGGLAPEQALPAQWQARMAAPVETVAVLAVRGGVPSLAPYPGFVPMTLPDRWGQVLAAGWLDASRTVDLTDRLQADGSLAWQVPEGDWQLIVVQRFTSDQMILEGAGRGPQLVLDHLQRAAFDAHAARVGDAALPHWRQHAGKAWRSIFVDSLEIPADLLWTHDLLAEFERRRGYDPRPHLPLMLQPGWRNCFQARLGAPLFDDPDTGPRVRHDYRLTVSELMIERLYAPMSAWAAGHGLQAKVQAHGAPVDWLQAYGVAGIPETEDLAGGAAPHFLRVARSAAHLYGRGLVTGEAFCWLQEGFAVTPAKLRERADAFYAAGIQQLVGHGASARLGAAFDAAAGGHPWYPFEAMEIGTPLDDANPCWAFVRPLTDYMARNQTLLQRGRARVPVAVLAPLDLMAHTSAAERLTPPPWHDALQDAGYDWDWINDHGLLASRLEAGALLTPGGHRYRALLLPELPALRAEVAEFLAACAEAGVPVWACGRLPSREIGFLDAAARDRRVQQAMRAARLVAPSALGRALLAAGVAPSLPLPAGHGCSFHVREDGAQQWVLLRNAGTTAQTPAWPLPPGQAAELWDAWLGEVQGLGTAGQVAVHLPPGCARWLRLAPAAACRPPPATQAALSAQVAAAGAAPAVERALGGPWQLSARGVGLGGRPIHFSAGADTLAGLRQHPELADFAGLLTYTLAFELSAAELAATEQPAGALWLDLGQAFDALSLQLNGDTPTPRSEGPFVFEVTRRLQAGTNTLTITVANVPENAHRDPLRPGGLPLPGRRLARLPTGLVGPVRLCAA
ncbi:glycosyl hydrolase [Aquabacterium sp. OR-4]|uniref:glycosyl hydrolase n=1 Tax=Aquabacterium sp. OR-4 TaxID=2978127 RepID=UPI0028C702D9|nr:glycosyl hydrolase [Aquabacterium sp. OR-4]MDT7837923.1 glycosyl hydrolase [Aquabacterium sp. OR-4]